MRLIPKGPDARKSGIAAGMEKLCILTVYYFSQTPKEKGISATFLQLYMLQLRGLKDSMFIGLTC